MIALAIIALVLAVGGFLLLGLPGAVFAGLAELVVAPLRGVPIGAVTSGDQAWGIAILLTLVVPWALPLGYWASSRLVPRAHWLVHTAGAFVGLYLWSVIVLFAITL